MSSQQGNQPGSQSVWTAYCGVNGEKHDCNIIKCFHCQAINPAIEKTVTVIDLSNDTPTSSPSKAVFAPVRGRGSSRGSSHGSHRSSSRFNSYTQGGLVVKEARQASIQRSAIPKAKSIRATIMFKLAKYAEFIEEGNLITRDFISYQLIQNFTLSFENHPIAGPDAFIAEILSELRRNFPQKDTDEIYLATSIKADGPVELPRSTANYTTTFEILQHFMGPKGEAQIWLILARKEKQASSRNDDAVIIKKEKLEPAKRRKTKASKQIKVEKGYIVKPEPEPDNFIRKRSFSTFSQSDAASSDLELPDPDDLLDAPAGRTRRKRPIES